MDRSNPPCECGNPDARWRGESLREYKCDSCATKEKVYYTVLVPWAEPAHATAWHPTEKTGPFAVLSRGAFKTADLAHTWAKKHLNSQPYSLKAYPDLLSED